VQGKNRSRKPLESIPRANEKRQGGVKEVVIVPMRSAGMLATATGQSAVQSRNSKKRGNRPRSSTRQLET